MYQSLQFKTELSLLTCPPLPLHISPCCVSPETSPVGSCPVHPLCSPPFSSCFCLRKSKRLFKGTWGEGGRGSRGDLTRALSRWAGEPRGLVTIFHMACCWLSGSPGPGEYLGKKSGHRMDTAGVRAGKTGWAVIERCHLSDPHGKSEPPRPRESVVPTGP